MLNNILRALTLCLAILLCMGMTISETFGKFTERHTVYDLAHHPAFAGFGEQLLPRLEDVNSTIPLRNVAQLMPWHRHIRPQVVITALNRMLADRAVGKEIFYNFYGDARSSASGLFFFRGQPCAPFAVICPGGGFVYVGSLHEGFPLAIELNKKGYNAFVLKYRTGGEQIACEDLAAALSWIFKNAKILGVSTAGYSLWGGSAGARMVANLGSYGAQAFGGHQIPGPSAIIMAYTGHSNYTTNDPPTFAVVGTDDNIASPYVMQRRVDALRQLGIDAELLLFEGVGHGFGIGTDTIAAGWVDDAVIFWERHR